MASHRNVPKRKLSREELLVKLDEQRELLHLSCCLFDEGKEISFMDIALRLRVLLHETKNSHSLLYQLNLENNQFVDSAAGTDNIGESFGWTGLVGYQVDVLSNAGRYVPLIANPDTSSRTAELRKFDEWWTMPAMRDFSGRAFSRCKLVSWVANQEGGAHVDPDLDLTFDGIQNKGLGYEIHLAGLVIDAFGNAAPAAIRQIAFETELSFMRMVEIDPNNWTPTLTGRSLKIDDLSR